MKTLFTRWGWGLGAAAGAATLAVVILLGFPRTQATAAEIMARGAEAVARLNTVHLRGQLRTAPADNFSYIAPEQDFVAIEIWKQFAPELKWRVEKPGRVAVMDGKSTVLYFKEGNTGVKLPQAAASAFDTLWLQELADLNGTLTRELDAIKAHGWPVTLAQTQGADGNKKSVVTVEAKSGLPDSDYLKNKFFATSDTRRVYVFDEQSARLESMKVYLHTPANEQLIFELTQLDYDQPIAPAVFELDLPANVAWSQPMQPLPDNARYAAMTPEQAARAFFEACGREDWAEVGNFISPVTDPLKNYIGGLTVVSIGDSFTSNFYPGRFVPYVIKFKNGEVKKFNLALKKDAATGRWFVDGGF